MGALWQDLKYAVRVLRKNPGFTAVAVLTLALGIGANTAVFSVVNAVLLKPLSYRDPDRIVTLTNASTTGDRLSPLVEKLVSIPNFQDWHDQSSAFEAMAYYYSWKAPVRTGSTAEYAQIAKVSPEFFRVFAIAPIVGRFFAAEEMKAGGAGAVMISYPYWQSHFGGEARALGQTIRVYDSRLPIVGVMPPGFGFPNEADLWFPVTDAGELMQSRVAENHFAIGRVKPGVSIERAQSEMTTIARRLEQEYPQSNKGRTVVLTRLQDEMVGEVRLTLYLLLSAVSVVLLIACTNVGTLLLGKATARTHEVAIRVALGASGQRIVRQMTTESLLLAFIAGSVGLVLAYWGSKALVAMAPADLPRLGETGIDRWVLAFTLGVSIITSLLFGLIPAFSASKVYLNDALKQGRARSVVEGGIARTRGMLVIAEIALAMALLSGAGLLVKTFVALQNVNLGFRPENVLVMKATVPASTPAMANGFFEDVLSRIAAVPGVLATGATMLPPGHVGSMAPYYFDRLPERQEPDADSAALSIVAPGTFAALGIPLKGGRDFNDGDTRDKPFVAVVNEALVRKGAPGENPIGRTIFCPFDNFKGMTIIGVVGNVRERGPALEPMPECYLPYRQHAYNDASLSVVARTLGNPTAFEQTFRRLAREVSPDVPVTFTTMERDASENIAAPRFRSLLFAVFAALAICLAMAGVYGMLAYIVAERTSELGIRIALGAQKSDVLQLVMGYGMILALAGVGIGIVGGLLLTRLLASLLYGVRATDPLTFIFVSISLTTVALVACWVPARRATRIDPMVALRHE